MRGFIMKDYQQKWIDRLEESNTGKGVDRESKGSLQYLEVSLSICNEILADDSGNTDVLSVELAKGFVKAVAMLKAIEDIAGNTEEVDLEGTLSGSDIQGIHVLNYAIWCINGLMTLDNKREAKAVTNDEIVIAGNNDKVVNKCGCGKELKYGHVREGGVVMSCNKYVVCLTYDEQFEQLNKLTTEVRKYRKVLEKLYSYNR